MVSATCACTPMTNPTIAPSTARTRKCSKPIPHIPKLSNTHSHISLLLEFLLTLFNSLLLPLLLRCPFIHPLWVMLVLLLLTTPLLELKLRYIPEFKLKFKNRFRLLLLLQHLATTTSFMHIFISVRSRLRLYSSNSPRLDLHCRSRTNPSSGLGPRSSSDS